MATPQMSDAVTEGVRIGASAFYLQDESTPADRDYVFGYNVVIANTGDQPVQLVSRHWLIIDSAGRREEVSGPGVVGQTPHLAPGEAFKYASFARIKTHWGTMEGEYQMRRDDGSVFDARIDRFYLTTEVALATEKSKLRIED
jgi:ApaG protein